MEDSERPNTARKSSGGSSEPPGDGTQEMAYEYVTLNSDDDSSDVTDAGGRRSWDGRERRRSPQGIKLPTAILLHVVGAVLTAAVSLTVVQARVDRLTKDAEAASVLSQKILTGVTSLEAKVEYLTVELQYVRQKADRIAEEKRGR